MKLTKRKALLLCYKMWDWLSNHPTKDKAEWPGWECNGGDIQKVENHCFACEYDTQNYKKLNQPCKITCIMRSLWPEGCTYEDSPFHKWDNPSSRKEWIRNARIIANHAYKLYRREMMKG